jgi:hypothetical protein
MGAVACPRRPWREEANFGGGSNHGAARHVHVPKEIDPGRPLPRRAVSRSAAPSGTLRGHPRDPAEDVALVARAKRELLLRSNRFRLRREELEDCLSQATLELVAHGRAGGSFTDVRAAGRALEVRFASRVRDRQRALSGRGPMAAAIEAAVRVEQLAEEEITITDRRVDVERLVLMRDELRRVGRAARALTPDQRLVLSQQLLDGEHSRRNLCEQAGWSEAKFRKVAQRARAKLRALTADDGRTVPPSGRRSEESAGTNQ